MRISISDECYWLLAARAAKERMKPVAYLEKLIRGEVAECLSTKSRPKGTFSDDELDQIRSLYRDKKGPTEIARRMERNKSSISYAINAMKKRGEL